MEPHEPSFKGSLPPDHFPTALGEKMRIEIYDNSGNKTFLPLKDAKVAFPGWMAATREATTNLEAERKALKKKLKFDLWSSPNEFERQELDFAQWAIKKGYDFSLRLIKKRLQELRFLFPTKPRRLGKLPLTESELVAARAVPIPDIVPVEFKRSGRNLVGLCPLHAEKTGSFTVFPDGRFKCFGCQQSGDSIGLFRLLNPGLGFVDAVRTMNARWPQ